MTPFVIHPCRSPNGTVVIPGDKSIAHRALILSALSFGQTIVDNVPDNGDCRATIAALAAFGVKITVRAASPGALSVIVDGKGARSLSKPAEPVHIDASGTTFRLLLGVAAGQLMTVTFEAGPGLSARPMSRIAHPLRLMGAAVTCRNGMLNGTQEEFAPVTVSGGMLKGISYTLPVASAQVKSALLLAGINAQGETSIIEPYPTRDHTERMLHCFHAPVSVRGNCITIQGGAQLQSPGSLCVPGDISSAAFFLVLAALCPGARVTVRRVSLNPSRTGVISVLRRMGADVTIATDPDLAPDSGHEPAADITVRTSRLAATVIDAGEIPALVDEIPLLMVAACYARGESRFKGVGELRVKETDRIRSMQENLLRMGADIAVESSGGGEDVVIRGTGMLRCAKVLSFGDHRTAMSMIVAGMCAEGGETSLDDVSCIGKSFPGFVEVIKSLAAGRG